MAFMQNNNFGNNNNNNSGERKSFPVGRIYAADGQIDVGIYVSASATWVTIAAKQSIGTNPSTGAMAMEQAQPQQIPSAMMSVETARAFLDGTANVDPTTLNFSLNVGGPHNGTFSVAGSPAEIRITIKDDRGERNVTLKAIPIGVKNVFAAWNNFRYWIDLAYKRAMRHKLNPEEFSAEINASSNDNDDAPF